MPPGTDPKNRNESRNKIGNTEGLFRGSKYDHSRGTKAVTLACLLFALGALMMPLRRIMGKDGLALAFLCVLLCCAGVAAAALSRVDMAWAGAGAALVLLSALLTPEGSKKT